MVRVHHRPLSAGPPARVEPPLPGYRRGMEKTRKLLSLLAASALIALSGCATDDAAERDAREAQPEIEQAGKDAEKAAEDAADAVDDNDSK